MSIELDELDEVSNLLLDVEIGKLSILTEKLLNLDRAITALKMGSCDQETLDDMSNLRIQERYQSWAQSKVANLNLEKARFLVEHDRVQNRARRALGRVDAINSLMNSP